MESKRAQVGEVERTAADIAAQERAEREARAVADVLAAALVKLRKPD